jgi:hypothetical protein
MKIAVVLVALVAIVNADIYLHNPRYVRASKLLRWPEFITCFCILQRLQQPLGRGREGEEQR